MFGQFIVALEIMNINNGPKKRGVKGAQKNKTYCVKAYMDGWMTSASIGTDWAFLCPLFSGEVEER